MFKRVLLCDDGSEAGRRALKRGAELAIVLGAAVHVLLILPAAKDDPYLVAAAAGTPCIVDDAAAPYQAMLDRSVQWLSERGVRALGYLARGNIIEQIVGHRQRLDIDLIVLGHYPQPSGGFWWSGTQRASLAERAGCCILVAMDVRTDEG